MQRQAPPPAAPAGLILAGGRATRLGGGDKTLRPIGGRPMLSTCARTPGSPGRPARASAPTATRRGSRLRPDRCFPTMARRARPGRWQASSPGWNGQARDRLRRAADGRRRHAVLSGRSRARLDRRGRDPAAASRLRHRAAGLHPVFGLWPVSSQPTSGASWPKARLSASRLFLSASRRRNSVSGRRYEGESMDPFFNVNTPQDLAAAEEMLQGAPGVTQRVFGITGWKNSGKTTLAEKLVAELCRRGWRVSTVKHAHHDFDIDKEGADSFRHRQAGASEVAVVSGTALGADARIARRGRAAARRDPCPPRALRPRAVEGYKREATPRSRRGGWQRGTPRRSRSDDPHIVAIAADHPLAARPAGFRSRRCRVHRRFHRAGNGAEALKAAAGSSCRRVDPSCNRSISLPAFCSCFFREKSGNIDLWAAQNGPRTAAMDGRQGPTERNYV